jgi:hypothetical protein
MASPTIPGWDNTDMPSLADLIRMGKQYIGDAMPGGSLNPETAPVARQANYLSGILDPASQVSQDATNWHKRTQIGLKDQLAGRQTPEAEQAYQTMMMAAGMAPIGMTAWHGSPHKFSKFSLDKIGTGEGAQAYGHGLYLAESRGVGSGYRDKLAKNEVLLDGLKVKHDRSLMDPQSMGLNALQMEPSPKSAADALRKAVADDSLWGRGSQYDQRANYSAAADWLEQNAKRIQVDSGHLYKTDIPDEAVARFLDWDKPVPEDLRQMISKKAMEQFGSGSTGTSGEHLYKEIARELGNPAVKNASPDASAWLAANGIPGIRYLDGGSRPTGQVDKQLLSMLDKHGGDPVAAVDDFMRFVHNTPAKKASMRDQFLKELQQNRTSNFVAFDPEMIRILERNGQATGLEPWKPGEYRLKDLIGKE